MWYADSLSAEVHNDWQATYQLPQASSLRTTGSLRTKRYADRLSAEALRDRQTEGVAMCVDKLQDGVC